MTGRLKKQRAPDRDRIDAVRLKVSGEPAHINSIEDRLLAKLMPESHGKVLREGLLADEGRRGDDRVTQLIPAEAALLRSRGGAGTRNPASGLLEYNNGSDSDSDSGISGGSGHDSFGGGYSGGGSMSDSTNDGGASPWGGSLSMTPGIAGMSLDQLSAIDKAIADDIDVNQGGMYGTGFTARTDGWASPQTAQRLVQELWNGQAYNAPGRYGMPTGVGPGIFGTAIAGMVGGPMSAMMGLGAAMGRAGGSYDSSFGDRTNGADRGGSATRTDALGSPVAGSGGSGGLLGNGTAQSAAAGTTSPDAGIASDQASLGRTPTVQPGQVMDTSGRSNNTLTGLPQPVQNLLMDYIWRGRQGTGFNW